MQIKMSNVNRSFKGSLGDDFKIGLDKVGLGKMGLGKSKPSDKPSGELGGGVIYALKNVNLTVESGEICGFVGANGAGKSTAMRIVMGVLTADSGEVFLDGQAANSSLREKIGYMPAERGLYPKMNVLDQLVFFGQLHGLNAKEAKVQAEKWIDTLSISQYANKKVQALSTGNQQRVQLAVALVSQPAALVLDEPFSGLDPIAVRVMGDVMREQAKKGVAILFSSHQLELVDSLCDKVAIIQKGEIIACGTPNELRQQANAPETVTIPTPLANIFGDIISSSAKNDEESIEKLGGIYNA